MRPGIGPGWSQVQNTTPHGAQRKGNNVKIQKIDYNEDAITEELKAFRKGGDAEWLGEAAQAIRDAVDRGYSLYRAEDGQTLIESPVYSEDGEGTEESIWLQTVIDYNLDGGDYECLLSDAEIVEA